MKGNLTIEVAELFPRQGEWTEEAYFSLPDTNRIVELSDGRLIMAPMPTYRHQETVFRLAIKLREFAERNEKGKVVLAPYPVRLWEGKIREPDIIFVLKENKWKLHEKYCDVPDLVVEVISPGTEKVDKEEKFKEYEKAGVKEYWICDPDKKEVFVYYLEEGKYKLFGHFKGEDKLRSKLLRGFEINLNEVWEER